VNGKMEWLAFRLPVEGDAAGIARAGDRVRADVPTCRPGERVGPVRERTEAAESDVCVVVNERRVVLGLLREHQLRSAPDGLVESVMELGPSTFRPSVSLEEMEAYFHENDLPSAPITTPDGVLVGLLRAERRTELRHERNAFG
jgi:Mg/Co/Ni transporter MgtE